MRLVRELEQDWSPEQIAQWLKQARPDDPAMRVSHETIYRTIYIASRRELGHRPGKHLRSGRSVRHARKAKQSHGRGVLRNMTSIRERPAVVTERVEVGHWEGDLVMGKRPSAVATLVERATRYVRVVPLLNGYKAEAVRQAIATDLAQLPPTLRKSLTWDRGREMAEHQELAADLAKGADLREFSMRDLDDIAHRINTGRAEYSTGRHRLSCSCRACVPSMWRKGIPHGTGGRTRRSACWSP